MNRGRIARGRTARKTGEVVVITAFVFCALCILRPAPAAAYPWILKTGHSNCTQCHVDPMGGGLLTPYGRAQGEIFLRTPWKPRGEDWEPGREAKFLFGAVPLPDWVQLGGSLRPAFLHTKTEGAGAAVNNPIVMQSDLRAHVRVLGKFRAYGSIAASTKVQNGWLNRGDPTNPDQIHAVSREHWVGYDVNDSILVQAGRMPLPFGIRTIQHTLYVRDLTRTTINDDQQHGLGVAYNGDLGRGAAMIILGNFQVRPAEYRDHGYSAFVERPVGPVYLGASSMAVAAQRDVETFLPLSRSAHGVSARTHWGEKLSLLGELDLLTNRHDKGDLWFGSAAYVQADYELVQGLHVMGILEWGDAGGDIGPPNYGYWLSAVWFGAPHVDVRTDLMSHWIANGSTTTRRDTFLLQMHFYL